MSAYNGHITPIGKIEDAGTLVQGGGVDRYWLREGIGMDFMAMFDENPVYPWLFDSELAREHFNLRSIEFGNWMSQEDRANFLYASMLSLHHLAQILGVEDHALGMNSKLSIALGARGHSRASGHYEPNPYAIINLTKTKGFGVLAHEFAHALDNIISFHTGNTAQRYVSGGRSTRKGYSKTIAKNGNWFEKQFEELFNILYFNNDGSQSDFSKGLEPLEEYWHRRTEVFARVFEVYISEKLKRKSIKNSFLAHSSYKGNSAYPKRDLVRTISPNIDTIISRAFKLFNNTKPLSGVTTISGYKGFRKTLKQRASVEDTLHHMQRIAYRDYKQVSDLAHQLEATTVKETTENIWNFLRANTRYKLDQDGIEELRTPARSLIDGKAGLTDKSFGIDCDDYTILISALLLNLNIPHEFRVAAYKEKGRFQHIYPVAFDSLGNQYIIDVVPEIPRFNYEAKPIIDLKKIPMELHELSGIDDNAITTEEIKSDLLEDLNQPFSLSGVDDHDEDDELFESHFLSGFGEVDSPEEAEITLHGTDDAVRILESGLLTEVHKARQSLIKEQSEPTILSQTINVAKEITYMDAVISAWNSPDRRINALQNVISSNSAYSNFFKAMLISLNRLDDHNLQGIDDEYNEPIYLARVPMEDYKLEHLLEEEDDLEGLGELGFFRRRRRRRRRRGFFRRFFKKIGKGIKKVVKAVVRFNPATILVRAAIRLVLKINLFKIASRLIYGYLNESQAKAQGLDINEWRKVVRAKNRAEKFYKKLGGKGSKFRRAIVRGKAAKKTGLQLGAAATGGSTAAASGFIAFIMAILKKVNIGKLFKRKPKPASTSTPQMSVPTQTPPFTATPTDFTNQQKAMEIEKKNESQEKLSFMGKVKAFFTKHKKKIMIVGIAGILVIIAVVFYKKQQKKKKRSLAGIKAARTRARNRKRVTTTRRRSPRQLKGSTTILRVPSKSVNRARVSKRSNGNRLRAMHKKAKELQKKHPKSKYSTLLKKAAKMI